MSLIVTVGRSAIKINVIPFVKKKMGFFCIKMKTLVCVSTIYVSDFFFSDRTPLSHEQALTYSKLVHCIGIHLHIQIHTIQIISRKRRKLKATLIIIVLIKYLYRKETTPW